MSPRFLELDELLYLHQRQLELYGGTPGIRDLGALQASLAVPESGIGADFFHRDLWEMAAAYLFHLSQNHPFVDGNKRVALAACRYFLEVNGRGFEGDAEALFRLTLATAAGKRKKAAIARELRAMAGRT